MTPKGRTKDPEFRTAKELLNAKTIRDYCPDCDKSRATFRYTTTENGARVFRCVDCGRALRRPALSFGPGGSDAL